MAGTELTQPLHAACDLKKPLYHAPASGTEGPQTIALGLNTVEHVLPDPDRPQPITLHVAKE